MSESIAESKDAIASPPTLEAVQDIEKLAQIPTKDYIKGWRLHVISLAFIPNFFPLLYSH